MWRVSQHSQSWHLSRARVCVHAILCTVSIYVCDSVLLWLGIEKLCEVKKAVDMNKGWYELQYKIRARMVSMLVRHGKLSQSSISGVSEVGGDETNKEGEPGALSESEGDADKAPPSQESSELGDEQVLSEEAMKEELTVILEMCKLNLDRKRLDSALPYFYVHGLLMKSVSP